MWVLGAFFFAFFSPRDMATRAEERLACHLDTNPSDASGPEAGSACLTRRACTRRDLFLLAHVMHPTLRVS